MRLSRSTVRALLVPSSDSVTRCHRILISAATASTLKESLLLTGSRTGRGVCLNVVGAAFSHLIFR
jgi:hypothetical protein